MTLERVAGMRVDSRERLVEPAWTPTPILGPRPRVFFNQVFRDGFFHGDMHPGNMLIEPDGTIIAMDFGIMGRLDLQTRRYLAEMLLGFLTRDYAAVADVYFRPASCRPTRTGRRSRRRCGPSASRSWACR